MLPVVTQILSIIELSLRIFLEMPPELKARHWENHIKWMELWDGILAKIKDDINPHGPV